MKNKLLMGAIILLGICTPTYASALTDDINSATSGDTVLVTGEITENLSINKSITLKGDKADKVMGNITVTGDNVNVVLDGFTLEGSINITAKNSKVTIKNMTLDGNKDITDNILVTVRAFNSDINVDNTTFQEFLKAGIYAETLKNISVTNSTFNGIATANIGSLEDYVASNPEAAAILRSAACIDLNLGNQANVKFDLESITIAGNHFEGIQNTAGEDSTAGAIKLKLKNASNVTMNDNTSAVIGANEFVKNADDVVIGTSQNPSTSNIVVAFYQNISSESNGIHVSNNGSVSGEEEVIDGSVVSVRNYQDSTDTNLNGDLFVITINDQLYMVESGTTLKDAVSVEDETPIDLDSFKTKEGYTFKNFVEAGTENVVDENTVITKSMTIEPVFEKIAQSAPEAVENPKTSDGFALYMFIALMTLCVATLSYRKIKA